MFGFDCALAIWRLDFERMVKRTAVPKIRLTLRGGDGYPTVLEMNNRTYDLTGVLHHEREPVQVVNVMVETELRKHRPDLLETWGGLE